MPNVNMFDCECEGGYNGSLCETGMTYTMVQFYYKNIHILHSNTALILELQVVDVTVIPWLQVDVNR